MLSSLFADDTTYQNHNNDMNELERETNEELESAANWFAANEFALHPKKQNISYEVKSKSDYIHSIYLLLLGGF